MLTCCRSAREYKWICWRRYSLGKILKTKTKTQMNCGAATKHTFSDKLQSLVRDPFPLPSLLSTCTPPPHPLRNLWWYLFSDLFLPNTDTRWKWEFDLWFLMQSEVLQVPCSGSGLRARAISFLVPAESLTSCVISGKSWNPSGFSFFTTEWSWLNSMFPNIFPPLLFYV